MYGARKWQGQEFEDIYQTPKQKLAASVSQFFRWGHIPPVLSSTLQSMVPGCPFKWEAVVTQQGWKVWVAKMRWLLIRKLEKSLHSHPTQCSSQEQTQVLCDVNSGTLSLLGHSLRPLQGTQNILPHSLVVYFQNLRLEVWKM